MARCARCSASGLTLKLDFSGFCHSCHCAMLQELADLRSFHEEYSQIPNAKEEADRILTNASTKAQQIIFESEARAEQTLSESVAQAQQIALESQSKAEKRLKDAEEKAASILSAHESDLKDQMKEASIKLSKIKKDTASIEAETKEFITNLLKSAAEEFSLSPKYNISFEHLREISKTHSIPSGRPTFVSLTPAKFCELAKYGYVAIDFETTGLYASADRIIEIGAIRYDENGQPLRRFHTFVNPGKPIPPRASQINNIYDADVANAPDISQVLPDFLRFIDGFPIIAHNSDFDVSFLKEAVHQCKIDYPQIIEYGDSIKLTKKHVRLKGYSLSSVAEHFNIYQGFAHRAIDDCETLGKIVNKLLKL